MCVYGYQIVPNFSPLTPNIFRGFGRNFSVQPYRYFPVNPIQKKKKKKNESIFQPIIPVIKFPVT